MQRLDQKYPLPDVGAMQRGLVTPGFSSLAMPGVGKSQDRQ